eukprot:gene21747-28768_t
MKVTHGSDPWKDFSTTACNNYFNREIGYAEYICVAGGDDEGCARMVSLNHADITKVGGGDDKGSSRMVSLSHVDITNVGALAVRTLDSATSLGASTSSEFSGSS